MSAAEHMRGAWVTVIRMHQDPRAPYWVQVLLRTVGYTPGMYLPAVVDDFGNLVIVGRPQ